MQPSTSCHKSGKLGVLGLGTPSILGETRRGLRDSPTRLMRGGRLICGLALAALGCGGSFQTTAAREGERWTEVQTQHFTLSTNLAGSRALDMARSLEEMRAGLLALAWTGARDPRGRTDVVVFSRPTEFDRYSGQESTIVGVAITRSGFERLLSFSPGPDNGLPEVAVHEMAHDLGQWFMPLMPAWLSEGLATFLEGLRFDRETNKAELGGLNQSSVEWLKSTGFLVRSSKLFALDSFQHTDVRESVSLYASSWLLVHYLLNADGERFGRFQSRLAKLEAWREAWQAEFPDVTPEELDASVVQYAKSAGFALLQGDLVLPPHVPKLRPLSGAEVHGVLARMSMLVGNAELAEKERLQAISLDPNELNALLVRFHSLRNYPPGNHPNNGSETAPADIAQQAVTAHPQSGAAWLIKAQSASVPAERAIALGRASELAPDHPGVRLLLAKASLQAGQARAALDHARVALRRSPWSLELLALNVRALAANRRCSEARHLEANAEGLRATDCNVQTDTGTRISCVDYLRQAWAGAEAELCPP